MPALPLPLLVHPLPRHVSDKQSGAPPLLGCDSGAFGDMPHTICATFVRVPLKLENSSPLAGRSHWVMAGGTRSKRAPAAARNSPRGEARSSLPTTRYASLLTTNISGADRNQASNRSHRIGTRNCETMGSTGWLVVAEKRLVHTGRALSELLRSTPSGRRYAPRL